MYNALLGRLQECIAGVEAVRLETTRVLALDDVSVVSEKTALVARQTQMQRDADQCLAIELPSPSTVFTNPEADIIASLRSWGAIGGPHPPAKLTLLSNRSGFSVSWTACEGALQYQLQLGEVLKQKDDDGKARAIVQPQYRSVYQGTHG